MANVVNAFVHVELNTTDVDKAKAGGAAFMLARECGPAPMFDGTRGWGVDEAFFKRLYGEERIGVLPNLHREQMHRLIGRSESGYGRSQTTYAGRLASAVALREALDGSNKETASARAKEFILSLKEVFPEADIDPAVDPQTDLVFEGYDHWLHLRDHWGVVRTRLVSLDKELSADLRCYSS